MSRDTSGPKVKLSAWIGRYRGWERTPREKYKVSARLVMYAAEKGSRSFESRCLTWFIGPMRTENLHKTSVAGGGEIISNTRKQWCTYPNITSKLPKLHTIRVREIQSTIMICAPEGKCKLCWAYRQHGECNERHEEADGSTDQASAKAQQPSEEHAYEYSECTHMNSRHAPVPSRQSKVRLFLVRPFAGPQRDVPSTYCIIEARKRIRRGIILLRVVVVPSCPTELGEVRSEILLWCRSWRHSEGERS